MQVAFAKATATSMSVTRNSDLAAVPVLEEIRLFVVFGCLNLDQLIVRRRAPVHYKSDDAILAPSETSGERKDSINV